MRLGDVFPSKYLKASDIPRPRVVTIDDVRMETIGGESKAVVYFEEGKKGLVLNVTNGSAIHAISGTDEMDAWQGTRVELYALEVPFQGKMVEGLRIRPPAGKVGMRTAPPPAPPNTTIRHDDEEGEVDPDVPF